MSPAKYPFCRTAKNKMKPVYQKIVDPGRGDCWRCAIASILELNAGDVPNFVGDHLDGGEPSHTACKKWLGERGLFLLAVNLQNEEWFDRLDFFFLEQVYCIMSVPSQRLQGGWHSVVGEFQIIDGNTELVVAHDPNVNNKEYPADIKPRRLQFILPVVPKIS